MTDSEWTNRFLSTAEFFALAEARLSLKTPEALTDPHIIPRDNDEDQPGPQERPQRQRPPRSKLGRSCRAGLAGASTSVKADAKCTRCLALHFWI
jgi:hypothetical protein